MRLLIYNGFDARQSDNYGQTPLHLACINGNLTAVKELVEKVRMTDGQWGPSFELKIFRRMDSPRLIPEYVLKYLFSY